MNAFWAYFWPPFGAAMAVGILVGAFRFALVNNEIPEVSGHLHHDPLTRRVLLSGPADNFQRSELIKLMGVVPGVRSATWSDTGGGLPLLAEGTGVAVLGFLLGLLV